MPDAAIRTLEFVVDERAARERPAQLRAERDRGPNRVPIQPIEVG